MLAVIGCWCLASQAHANIYWSTFQGTTIESSASDGSGVNPSFVTGGESIYGLAVDGSYVYWLNEETGSIGRAKLDGTEVNQNFVTGIYNTYDDSLAVDAGHIYWSNYYGESIGRANINGTEVEEEFISGVYFPYSIAVQGGHLYWSGYEGNVARANINGTEVEEEFIPGVSAYYGIAVNSEHIYWTTAEEDTIARADLDGKNVNPNFIAAPTYPTGIAVDNSHVYWTTLEEGVFSANLDGTGQHNIVAGNNYYYVMAADLSQPTLSSVASPSSTLGTGPITDTATLAGATGPSGPTGTLVFNLYGPGNETCAGSPAYTDTVAVAGNGNYSPKPFTPTVAGTYRWTVAYSGDFQPLATSCAAATAAVKVSAASAGPGTVHPQACTVVTASAGTFVPLVKPGKVVSGLRAEVKVSTPSHLTVAPTLTYKDKSGKSRSAALESLAFDSAGSRKLRIGLPAKLSRALPVGTWVHLSLRISANPHSAPSCTSPSVSTKHLKVKVVRVLKGGQAGVS